MVEKTHFRTSDGVEIVGSFYPSSSNRSILLLHMMPATKESWHEFAQNLIKGGFNALAIDLRGHGESTKGEGRTLNYQEFSDGEHQKSLLDIDASREFLRSKGLELYAIAGASIGANLALWFQAEHPEIKKTILLSAGFDYRGIQTKPLVQKLKIDQGIYLAGGSLDQRSDGITCGQVAGDLNTLAPVTDKKVEVLETSAHGTDLFSFDSTLMGRLIDWIGE